MAKLSVSGVGVHVCPRGLPMRKARYEAAAAPTLSEPESAEATFTVTLRRYG